MKIQLCGSRLGRVPCQSKLQRKNAGTSSWPSWISHFTGSFVGHSPSEMLCPPANRVKFHEKFYTCSDVTHTHLAYSEVYFWKSFAGGIGNKPVRVNLSGTSVQVVLISLRREILFHLKYLDRVVEAHAINHPPSFVDFPRCRSSRQSV